MGQRSDEIRRETPDAPTDIVETRVEIEQTRADMSETIDAIQERLSPQNVKEQVKTTVQDATTKARDRAQGAIVERAQGARSTMIQTIKQNPMPAALTAVSLGWLVVSGRTESSGQGSDGSSSSQTAGQTHGKARETASHARDRVRQTAGQAQQQVSQLGNQAQNRARRVKGGFQRMLQENPLAVGAIAVGLGAAVGLAIPETSKENQMMGETRDSLVEKAQGTRERVQRVAEEIRSTAKRPRIRD